MAKTSDTRPSDSLAEPPVPRSAIEWASFLYFLQRVGREPKWRKLMAGHHLGRHDLFESSALSPMVEHLHIGSAKTLSNSGLICTVDLERFRSYYATAPNVLEIGSAEQQFRQYCYDFATHLGEGEKGSEKSGQDADPTVPEDSDRLAFLADAAKRGRDGGDPLQKLDAAVRADAVEVLGGDAALGRAILSEEDLVEALATGFPADVLSRLREAGYPYAVLEQVVAPRRTLMRRKASQQRLTRAESDAAWRLAHVLSLAARVLDGRKAALAWLGREKGAFKGRAPIDLLETSVGTAYVERILRSLDWGDVA